MSIIKTINNMSDIQTKLPTSSTKDSESEESSLSLLELWYLCISHWPWFIVSIFLCLCAATLYLLRTPKQYTRSMEVLIKSDKRDYNAGSMADFADMGLFQSSSNVNNEMLTMLSPDLAYDVVREMNLNTSYSRPGFFRSTPLYGNDLPVQIIFCDPNVAPGFSFRMELEPNGSFVLTDFDSEKVELGSKGEILGKLSADTIQGPYGPMLVMPSPAFSLMDGHEAIKITHVDAKEVAKGIASNLKVSVANKQATVLSLSFVDIHPQRNEDILNTLVRLYNKNWVSDKNQIAVSTSEFINERLAVIEQELGNVDENISDYQSKNLITDFGAANQMYMRQANEAVQNVTMLNNQLSMAQFLKQYVNNPDKQFDLMPANSGVEDRTIEQMITAYNQKQLQRNTLITNSSANNPVVKDLEKELTEMRSNLVSSIDNTITSLQAQIRSYQRTEQQSNAQMASNPTRAKYLLSVERQQKVKEQLYLYLLQKREENELSQAFTAYNTRIITAPNGSKYPTSPGTKKVLLLALLAGLLIPAAYLYLRETMVTAVRGRKDLQRLTAPFIGELPLCESYSKGNRKERSAMRFQLQVKPDNRNMINEAFRIISTNIDMVAGKKTAHPAKVIMFTSMNASSGKTFTTMNLAATYAIAGLKTLVVDLDIRKRTSSKYAGLPKNGITGLLNGTLDEWRPCVVNVADRENLNLLPAGRIVPNPTELLRSERLEQILQEARAEYDIIFLDCPPTDIVADTALVKDYADLTIFVIRCGVFQRSMIPMVEQFYNEGKFNRMNILLNGSEASTSKYGYSRYGYAYGYGYGTGYGSYYSSGQTKKK